MDREVDIRRGFAHRSHRKLSSRIERLVVALAIACVPVASIVNPVAAAERTIKVVALGDSLTAGPASGGEPFPTQLETILKAKGIAVEILNAGVPGDTSFGGLARLDSAVPEDADAVILELGTNDMFRGVDPDITRTALDQIISRLMARGIEVLLCGMVAERHFEPNFVRVEPSFVLAFNAIYPELAAAKNVLLYPHFLEGVATDPQLHQGDGLHPNAAGVGKIVDRVLPQVEILLGRVRTKHAPDPIQNSATFSLSPAAP